MWQVEQLEGRRLMTVIIGSTFDPIVGPVGPNPGTIGGPYDVEPTGRPSGYLSAGGSVFFLGFGSSTRFVRGSNWNNRGNRDVIGGGATGSSSEWNSNLFFNKGFPVHFGDGAYMRYRNGVLSIVGTVGNDAILVSRIADRTGRVFAMDVTVNGDTRRFDAIIAGNFIRSITIDGDRGDDVIAGEADFNIPMILRGGKGNDSLAGGLRNDTLVGGDGKDYLVGGEGKDLLQGENGNDTLDGGAGADRLVGGVGDDVFINGEDDASDTVDGGKGHDTADKDSEDVIKSVEG